MKNKTLFLIILFGLIVSGCMSAETEILIINTQVIESTDIYNSPTLEPIITTTWANNSCWKTEPIENRIDFAGSLLYYDPVLKQSIILDLKSFETKQTIRGSVVSSGGNLLASYDHDAKELYVVSQTQEKKYITPDNLFFYGDDFSDDGIKLNVGYSLRDTYQEDLGVVDKYYVFSPETENFEPHSIFLPYFYLNSYNKYFYISYSPDLRYVIYPADYPKRYGKNILFDTLEGKIIWYGAGNWGFPSYDPPIWKPDGSAVTVIDHETSFLNFYNIFIDGQYLQITNFEKVFDSPIVLSYMAWSPDSRYLAFTAGSDTTIQNRKTKGRPILIFDTQSNQLINPCISLPSISAYEIKWSPNSKHFAIIPYGWVQIVVADLETQKNYEVYKHPEFEYMDPYEKADQSILGLSGWLSWEIP